MRRVLRVLRSRRGRIAGAVAAAVVVGLVALRCWPVPASLLRAADPASTIVVDRHGTILYEALSASGARARPLQADALPPVLVAATIAAEDAASSSTRA